MSKFLTVSAGNCKTGTTKNGNPWLSIGLVEKAGANKGTWHNYFMVITDKTKERVKKDLATMGITNPDPEAFECDRRLFTAIRDFDEFFKDERVVKVLESKFQPDATAVDDDTAF